MTRKLHDELKQKRPFSSLEQEAYLSLGRTWSMLEHSFAEALKPHGITPTQFNVLRILRGAGDEGLCRNDIMDRMVARVPDATRLLDRLESAGLIVRSRSTSDRRFVTTQITDDGLRVLAKLDEIVGDLHQQQFEGLTEEELGTLVEVLGAVREGLERAAR